MSCTLTKFFWSIFSNVLVKRYGDIGLGDIVIQKTPELLMEDVKSVYSGNTFLVIWKKNNEIWVCGEARTIFHVNHRNVKVPIKLEGITGENLKQISCGYGHVIFWKKNGEIWALGVIHFSLN